MTTPTSGDQAPLLLYPSTVQGTTVYLRHREPALRCCHGHVSGLDRAVQRRAVSVHEAGHLLVALVIGMHVERVRSTTTCGTSAAGPARSSPAP